MNVVPGAFNAAKQQAVFICAEPIFSKKFIGLTKLVPSISNGKEFFFVFIFAPNSFNGFVTLAKSLFDKLLSPINFIF